MKRWLTTMVAAVATAVLAGAAFAATGDWDFTVGGGAHVPGTKVYRDAFGTGWLAGAGIEADLADYFALGIHGNYNQTQAKQQLDLELAKRKVQIIDLGVHANLYLTPTEMVRPYLTGVAGEYWREQKVQGLDNTTTSTRTRFGYGGGAGIQFLPASGNLGFGVEGVYNVIPKGITSDAGDDLTLGYWGISGRLMWLFTRGTATTASGKRY